MTPQKYIDLLEVLFQNTLPDGITVEESKAEFQKFLIRNNIDNYKDFVMFQKNDIEGMQYYILGS